MTPRKAIKGALEGFLGTYVSRYSEYAGYWLFGFLVSSLQHLHIDLLADQASVAGDTPDALVLSLARSKFRDQVAKVGLSLKSIRAAELEITRGARAQRVLENGQVRDGYSVLFRAIATMDNDCVYERQRTVFVSPHDASIERQSARVVGEQTRPRTNQALKGALVGAVSGPIALATVSWLYDAVSTFPTSLSVHRLLLTAAPWAFVSVLAFGLSAAVLGASVGAFSGITRGGRAAGVEWLGIVGVASFLGAWGLDQRYQAFDGLYAMYVIPIPAVGGLVGLFTWALFRVRGPKRPLSRVAIIGYLVTFLLGLTIGPCAGAYLLLVFFDK